MGVRFNLSSANWLAYLLEPNARVPNLGASGDEREILHIFLQKLSNSFYSTPCVEHKFGLIVERSVDMARYLDNYKENIPDGFLKDLRGFLGGRPWTALIIPSGDDEKLDEWLSQEDFLRALIQVRPDDPGLILQLDEPPQKIFSLLDVFPAFKIALNESTNWPGVLLWHPTGDSAFFPFGTSNTCQISDRANWIFSHLATSLGFDLGLFKAQYLREFPDVVESKGVILHFLQLSDLHLGSREASLRLPRVQQLVRNVVEELGTNSRIVPVVSGDLMDSPNEKHLNAVRAFWDFLSCLGTDEPILVLGNHDVRKDGYLNDNFKTAVRLSLSKPVWYENEKVGLLCVNSVTNGKLARGFVGESQLIDLGNEIDRKKDSKEYKLVAMLHHHPLKVEYPEWYARPFYERILGTYFEKTDELEDAVSFLSFAKARSLTAILHGHKHIPQVTNTDDGIPVFGCGSTVGKVPTTDNSTYMSLNVVSINNRNKSVSGRLLAERIPGGGLIEQRRHEILVRSSYAIPTMPSADSCN